MENELLLSSRLIKILCLLLIFSFAGCETTRIKYVESNDFPKDKHYHLKTVYFKDGSTVDLSGKDAKFKRSFKCMNNVIVYDYEEKFIELKDISSLKIEVVESNTLVNVLIIVGSVVLFFFILVLLLPFDFKMH